MLFEHRKANINKLESGQKAENGTQLKSCAEDWKETESRVLSPCPSPDGTAS